MTGGSATWLTGSFDPELNLLYWGVGNPAPDFNGDVRESDKLYSKAVVALNADTGDLESFFQFTPHDEPDWDASPGRGHANWWSPSYSPSKHLLYVPVIWPRGVFVTGGVSIVEAALYAAGWHEDTRPDRCPRPRLRDRRSGVGIRNGGRRPLGTAVDGGRPVLWRHRAGVSSSWTS